MTLSFADMWRSVLVGFVLIAVVTTLLVFRLGSLAPVLSPPEQAQRAASSSVTEISNNPLFLHHKAGLFLLQKAGQTSTAAIRLPGAAIALLFTVSMYSLLKFWYTRRVALLGSLLLASSSWFLSVARLASPDINFVLPFVLAVGGIWLYKRNLGFVTGLFLVLVGLTLLYVPGMIWLLLSALVWQWRTVKNIFERIPLLWQGVYYLILIIGTAPLVMAFTKDTQVILSWLGLPVNWPTLGGYLNNLIEIPVQLFVRGVSDPIRNLGRLPLLDAFTGTMVGLGIFASFFRFGLDRTRLVIGTGIIGCLLIALNGQVTTSFLLPHIYILASSGLALMLQQWLTVFPRNPFAKGLGVVLISASVFLAGYYHLSRYFVAWSKSPETKSIFRKQ